MRYVGATFIVLLEVLIAAIWLLIGIAFLIYPRQITRYYADYNRNNVAGPLRVIARPLARYIESPVNVWTTRLIGVGWIVMGVFVVYFLRFA